MAIGGDSADGVRPVAWRVLIAALVTVGLALTAVSAEARERHNPWSAQPHDPADVRESGRFGGHVPPSAGTFAPPGFDPGRREVEEPRHVQPRDPRPYSREAPGFGPEGHGPGPYGYGAPSGAPGYGFPFFFSPWSQGM